MTRRLLVAAAVVGALALAALAAHHAIEAWITSTLEGMD